MYGELSSKPTLISLKLHAKSYQNNWYIQQQFLYWSKSNIPLFKAIMSWPIKIWKRKKTSFVIPHDFPFQSFSWKFFQDKIFHLPLNFLLPPNFNFFLFLFGVVGGRTDHWCQWHLEFEVTYKIFMGIRIDERDRKGPRKVSHVDETNGPLTSWTLSKCPSLLGMLQIFNPGTQWS